MSGLLKPADSSVRVELEGKEGVAPKAGFPNKPNFGSDVSSIPSFASDSNCPDDPVGEHQTPAAAVDFPLIDQEADCIVSQSGCPTQLAADETVAATSAETTGPLNEAAGSQEAPMEQGNTDDTASEEDQQLQDQVKTKDSGLLFGCLPQRGRAACCAVDTGSGLTLRHSPETEKCLQKSLRVPRPL